MTRTSALALVALVATALVLVGPVRGAGEAAVHAAASAWNAAFGDRPHPTFTERVLVVLSAPSLSDRVVARGALPSAEEQRRWVREAEAAQRLLLATLRERGVEIKREHSFTRTLNGFSALVDPRAVAELERSSRVAGVYPVRVVYPASVASETLARPEFARGEGRRPDVSLPGLDGGGVTIALLDTGVDLRHSYLRGRVLPGVDILAGDAVAAAEANPDEPMNVESHGTRMAGILVGAGGPAELGGVAPGASVLPIRVLGWQQTREGSFAVLGYGDQLLAGLERAVDPDGDGDVDDRARIALAPVVEPYASFADSPEARAVTGASRLGTLVVAPAGNDGRAGAGFGTVGAPGGAAAALTVGALDARREVLAAELTVRVGLSSVFGGTSRLLGAVAPNESVSVPGAALLGPTLADPRRGARSLAGGDVLADFFDAEGASLVAGRAVLLPDDGRSLATKVSNAAAAGAAAVVVYGTRLPAGALDLDERAALPVIALTEEAGRAAVDGLTRAAPVTVSLRDVERAGNETFGEVAGFSSRGLAFDGRVKPDLVAAGVGIATSDAGSNGDGSARFATVTGSSAAAAIVAGSAALIAQARSDLSAAELKSVLVGSARQVARDGSPEAVTAQGAGLVDPAAALAAELTVEPATLAFGRARAASWRARRTLTVRNVSTRPLQVGFGVAPDAPAPRVAFAVDPARLHLAPGEARKVKVSVAARARRGLAGGALVVSAPGARPVRVPWAVSFSPPARRLVTAVRLSHSRFQASDSAPVVLAFRAGRVATGRDGRTIEPLATLDAELWTADGRRLGVIARLRDVLPGRYAFGLTGRGPGGSKLSPGTYVVRLRARPVDGKPLAATADAVFTIVR